MLRSLVNNSVILSTLQTLIAGKQVNLMFPNLVMQLTLCNSLVNLFLTTFVTDAV